MAQDVSENVWALPWYKRSVYAGGALALDAALWYLLHFSTDWRVLALVGLGALSVLMAWELLLLGLCAWFAWLFFTDFTPLEQIGTGVVFGFLWLSAGTKALRDRVTRLEWELNNRR